MVKFILFQDADVSSKRKRALILQAIKMNMARETADFSEDVEISINANHSGHLTGKVTIDRHHAPWERFHWHPSDTLESQLSENKFESSILQQFCTIELIGSFIIYIK